MLKIRNLSPRQQNKALFYLPEWQVEERQSWVILGPNGCGKSTLLHWLAGLHDDAEGEMKLFDKDLKAMPIKPRSQQIGLVLQEPPFNFPLTVKDCILAGRHPWTGYLSGYSKGDRQLALEAADQFNLKALLKRSVTSLSGGEKRRVSLAALFAQDPTIALFDEVENHLDPGTRIRLLKKMKAHFSRQGHAALFVLHDLMLASPLATHAMLIFSDASVLVGNADDVLTARNLSRLYQHDFVVIENNGYKVFQPA